MGKTRSKKRILIVEDQLIIALDLELILKNLGYEVVGIVNTGEECVEFVKNNRPDLVLMDIMLSGDIDGIAAAEVIHKTLDVPIIYLTAHSDEKSLERAHLTGPYGYIVKPIQERELYTSIEIALHRFSMDRVLKKSEMKYRTLFEQSLDPIFITDENAVIIDANPSMVDLFGYPISQIIGHRADEFFKEQNEYQNIIALARTKGAVSNFECRMITKSGRVLDVQITVRKYEYGWQGGDGYQGIIRDITQYKLYFEELLRSRQELRNLTAHIENLREQERTDIAREIHDVLGQSLTALRLDLSWVRKKIKPEESDLVEKISIMDVIINDIISTVRKLSTQLRPGILDDLGLPAAIEWQTDEFKKRTGINCCVDCGDVGDLPEDKSVALFRIFQESFTNIMKHSCADNVIISLQKSDGNVEMMIKDNGKGFSGEDLQTKGSYGIIGMKERVKNLNGTLTIDGNSGTTIRVVIPG
ncbi:MAG TPA: response regulator [Spirochaetota bacterium]|mgnify:CR=1 FL=1|nr:response regulator [Spirochaetota bacterium]HPF04668.1 response regulator [Spirochaetota bacterium]HPJ44376.1 response regulator [Spirochaetota bacterium]HPR37886.1 response regulator [Spirochaetota bacterium]HRX46471.1 response regulator [Spirochaetota bacterium]